MENNDLLKRAESVLAWLSNFDEPPSAVGGDFARVDTLMIRAYTLGFRAGEKNVRKKLRELILGGNQESR